MKRNRIAKLVREIVFACIGALSAGCGGGAESGRTAAEEAFVRWAAARAVPFSSDDAGRERMLDAIGEAVGDARVVAVSEAAHNVREFMETNAAVARYLIERKGFNTVVVESGFPESKAVDDYIQGKPVDRPAWTGALTGMYGRWSEFTDLIEWMREYNLRPGTARPVRFYGLDIAGFYTDLRPLFGRIADGLEQIDPAGARRLRSDLGPLFDIIGSGGTRRAVAMYRDSLTTGQKYRLEEKIARVVESLENGRERAVARLGDEAYERLLQETVSLFQTILYYKNSAFRDRAYREYVGLNGRELAMARSFQWICRSDTTAKIVVISHNIHTKTRPSYLDDTFEFFVPFGAFVRKAFGDAFYSIGCAYDRGEYWDNWKKNEPRVIKQTPPAQAGVIDHVLKSAGRGSFFVDLSRISPDSPARSWLRSETQAREHGDRYAVTPGEFDGFLYYDTISLPAILSDPADPVGNGPL